jgi:Flp pilus assembly protein TadG
MRRRRRGDESGQALVEFALVLPLVALLMAVAFNGWNGIQLSLRLTSGARAGAIAAANYLATQPTQPANAAELQTAQDNATADVNAEENTTIYQDSNSSQPDYVGISTTSSSFTDSTSATVTINVVRITISQVSVDLVPIVGAIGVSVHASAEYS